MNELKKKKIWGCITTSEAIDRLSKYKYFFANSDHCLVISDEQPEDTVEMTGEYIRLFKSDDWMWLFGVLDDVRKEQIENNADAAAEKRKSEEEFLKRFRKLLEEWREQNAGGTTENE